MKFYAIAKGLKPGVYTDWDTAQQQIQNEPKAKYQTCDTFLEAIQFINEIKRQDKLALIQKAPNLDAIIYVSGFNHISDEKNTQLHTIYTIQEQKTNQPLVIKTNRIKLEHYEPDHYIAELVAVNEAVKAAIDASYLKIEVHYLYDGVKKLLNGQWQAKTIMTKNYVKSLEALMTKINIIFIKENLRQDTSVQAQQTKDAFKKEKAKCH